VFHDLGQPSAERSVDAGAEEGVHDEVWRGGFELGIESGEILSFDHHDWHTGRLCQTQVFGGVGAQGVRIREEQHPDLVIAAGQEACCGEPITSIVAAAAENEDPPCLWETGVQGIDHAGRGVLHQFKAGNPQVFDGVPVGIAHGLVVEHGEHRVLLE